MDDFQTTPWQRRGHFSQHVVGNGSTDAHNPKHQCLSSFDGTEMLLLLLLLFCPPLLLLQLWADQVIVTPWNHQKNITHNFAHRWSTLPHYSIAKLLLTFPLIYHLSYNIYYIRRECCSSGIPYRPAFREISGSGENEKYRKVDEATLNFYRGVLIAFGVRLQFFIDLI